MPIVSCKICKKSFYAKPNWLKKGHGKYCSRQCQFKAQEKGSLVNCYRCGKLIWRQPRFLKRSEIFFCTKDCMMRWRNKLQRGTNHPNWKGEKRMTYNSYYKSLLTKVSIKPTCKRCNYGDKRALLVHHLDGNRGNNDISNLIPLCYNCHYLVHNYSVSLK